VESPGHKNIFIGTSGFSYKDWLGNFYPQFCSQKDFLRFYSAVFSTVEIDATFYRIPDIELVKRWTKVTPDNFRFTAKFPRMVTHEGSFDERKGALESFVDHMRYLDGKLGPLLMQFPYSFTPEENSGLLHRLLDILPEKLTIAVEVRNKKWLGDLFYESLKGRNICLCLMDHPWMPRMTTFTADFAYIRLLGDRRKIGSDFSHIRNDREDDLKWWAELIESFSREKGEVYAYVNNHYTGHSPTTARRLAEIIGIELNSRNRAGGE
jgi:uncharacterized protein YecE (DUF72 family)